MSDMALFCYSCSAMGNLVKCCPDAPGSVALVPVGFANGVARTIGKLHDRVTELESRLAEIEAQEPVLECLSEGTGQWRECIRPDYCTNRKRLVYARPVPAHLYCPNCYCTCCMNETRSNAK